MKELKMNTTANRYFDMAYEYHVAALTLYYSLFDASYLYNPTVYMLRHSIELLLKGLIIREEKKNRRVAASKIKINGRPLNNTHSLLVLWNYFKSIYPISEDDILTLNTAISKLNKKDFSSDRYRYPYKKNGTPIPVEPVVFEIADKAPDLEKGIPYIIQSQHEVKIASKGSSLMMDIKTLFEEIEILFDISEAD